MENDYHEETVLQDQHRDFMSFLDDRILIDNQNKQNQDYLEFMEMLKNEQKYCKKDC